MGWTNSKIMAAPIEAILEGTAMDLDTDTFKIALYTNAITPDNTVALANAAYDVDQWGTANEVYDGTNWDQAGEPLTGVTSGLTGAVYKFDATDTPQGGATCTLANVYGGFVYDDTVAGDYGLAYLYFGGVQTVTGGTFTVQYAGTGIAQLTMT